MNPKFDIFKKLPDGHPLWVKAVDGLEEAKTQLARLAASAPGEYFIYSVKCARVVETQFATRA
jgi:hypothetical protein